MLAINGRFLIPIFINFSTPITSPVEVVRKRWNFLHQQFRRQPYVCLQFPSLNICGVEGCEEDKLVFAVGLRAVDDVGNRDATVDRIHEHVKLVQNPENII